MRTKWLILFLFSGLAFSQEAAYERAKVPLRGAVSLSTLLYKEASERSASLAALQTNDPVVVVGRKGSWFQVEFEIAAGESVVGWVSGGKLRILGAAEPKSAPKRVQVPEAKPTPPKPQTEKDLHVIPRAGYSWGAKGLSNQVRAGVDILYAAWSPVDVGGSIDIALLHDVMVAGGPTFRAALDWPRIRGTRFALYGGPRGYFITSDAGNDSFFGIRFGSQLLVDFVGPAKLVLDIGADSLLVGGETTAAAVTGQLGVAFRF